MCIRKNWLRFMEITNSKSIEHARAARHWDRVDHITNYIKIFLAVLTCILTMVKGVPVPLVGFAAALSTLATIVYAFLKPANRRQKLDQSSNVSE